MVSKRELLDTYGEERDGQTVMVCPTCSPEITFDTLEQWKEHMTKEHGGYTSSEVAAGQAQTGASSAGTEPQKQGQVRDAPAPKPKRMSQRARELNDALNRCVSLTLQHVISGISEEERKELEGLRTKITEAFVGVEFDFEERLVSLSGKWAVLIVLVLLYTLPQLPTMKDSIARAIKAKQEAKPKPNGAATT